MKKITLLLVSLVSVFGIAQPYDWTEISQTTISIKEFEPFDFDSDGDLDLVAGPYWLENDGNGNILQKHVLSEDYLGMGSIRGLYLGDVSGDASFDMVLFDRYKIRVVNQPSSDEIEPLPFVYSGFIEVLDMQVIDFDLDGDQDIVFLNVEQLAWIENLGSSNFSSPNTILWATDLRTIETIDYDGDNDLDIICGTEYNSIADILYLENSGNNVYNSIDTLALGDNRIGDLELYDLDGDNDLDIVSCDELNGEIRYYENSGNLDFLEFTISNNVYKSYEVLIEDVNNDGTMDILACGYGTESVFWYENSGSATFTQHFLEFPKKSTSVYPDLHFDDFNGDGEKDILHSIEWQGGKISWSNNLTNGDFGDFNNLSGHTYNLDECYPVDLDNDGDLDVVTITRTHLFWYENLGETFSAIKEIYEFSSYTEYGWKSLCIYDFDDDGDQDMIASKSNSIFVENLGNGNFDVQNSNLTGHNMELGYVNDDTLMDVLYSYSVGDEWGWFENLGSNSFVKHVVSDDVHNGPADIFSADMDNDGDNDVVFSSTFDLEIGWYENDGAELFSNYQLIAENFNIKSFCLDDLDGDDKMDVIAVSHNKTVWYQNLGNDSLSTAIVIDSTTSVYSRIYADDIDNDGDLDVITGAVSGLDYLVQVDTNNNFVSYDMSSGLSDAKDGRVRSIITADIDQDNDLDIVSCGLSEYNVFYYGNQLNNSFSYTTSSCFSFLAPSGDSTYYLSTTVYDTIPNSNGGDSTLIIDLTILGATDTTYLTEAICIGDTFYIGSSNYFTSGNYIDTFANQCGSDSLIYTELTVMALDSTGTTVTLCEGDTIYFGSAYYFSPGIYFDTLENIFGCDSISSLNLQFENINTTITQIGSDLTAVQQNGATYQWYQCDGDLTLLSGETDPTLATPGNGEFAVEITINGCSELSECIPIIEIGLDENYFSQLDISPNPTTGLVNIHLGNLKNTDLKVYSLMGRKIVEVSNIMDENYELKLHEPAGIYILEIHHSGRIQHYKLIKN